MLRVYADKYILLGQHLEMLRTTFRLAAAASANRPDDPDASFDEDEQKSLQLGLKQIIKICEQLDLPVSGTLASNAYDDAPKTLREFDLLVSAVMAEIKDKLFLFVPHHRAKYYELILQSAITNAFSQASKEIVSAGNCLTSGLYTASVFHSMRAAEIGVRVLGGTIGVSFPDKPIELAEWQNILDQCDSKIVAMKELPRGAHKDEELNFYSQAAVQFRYFKDAWRVRVAHARETYEEATALRVFNHTLEFFETLATGFASRDTLL